MAKKVIIYTTPSCPYSIRAKEFLNENNVEFEEADVSSNEDRAREMVEKTGQMGVPVLDIDGEIVLGFDRGAIKEALGI